MHALSVQVYIWLDMPVYTNDKQMIYYYIYLLDTNATGSKLDGSDFVLLWRCLKTYL